MAETAFQNSDSTRSARPLRYAHTVNLSEPLELERGGRLDGVCVTYETYGQLNQAGDNAVLVCHALSGDSHVAMHEEGDDPGWWDIAVGPGKAIDTDKYYVICSNALGGCRGTTGPNSIDPATGRCYGPDFPTVTVADMVGLQRRLVDHLGIRCLRAVVGGSMGGQQALLWPVLYGDRLAGAMLVATSSRLSSQALAFDVVARNAILHDPNFHHGRYFDTGQVPHIGLAIARMIGHITYLSRQAMTDKFDDGRNQARDVPVIFEKEFSVGSYLGYQGTKFVERFDANSYITLSMAMDLFDLGGSAWELIPRLQPTTCRWLVVSFASDWLFPPEDSRQLVHAMIAANKHVTYCNVASQAGHDAFLLPDDLDSYGGLMAGFLANLDAPSAQPPLPQPSPAPSAEQAEHRHSRTSIFHPDYPQRLDVQRIVDLIPPGVSVLDLGCGGGLLLEALARRSHERLMGVELDERAVVDCAQRGLSVVQADMERGLAPFADKQFDYVVLSQTLQSIRDVEGVVDEMLRVGRRGVVSFPNFGYHKLRSMFFETGRMPESPGQLRHKWYNTPNIRFLTIADFREFCRLKGIEIHRCACLDTEAARDVAPGEDCNLTADMAIFVLSR